MKKFEFVSQAPGQAAMKAYLSLPKDVQYQFGTDLNAVQQGKDPFLARKVLTESVGPGSQGNGYGRQAVQGDEEEGGCRAKARQDIRSEAREMSYAA